jgi:hypothetical protein
MSTTSSAQAAMAAPGAPEAELLASAVEGLGPGWQILARPGGPGARPLWEAGQRPVVLANAALGLVLLDIAPRASTDAAERLRAALAATDFAQRFPGQLPIVHRMLPREHIGRLPDILDYALSWEPPLTLPAGEAWMDAVAQVIEGGPPAAAATGPEAAPEEDPVPETPAAQEPQPNYATPLLIGWTLMLAIGAAVATWQSAPAPRTVQAPAAQEPDRTGSSLGPALPPRPDATSMAAAR